MKLVLNSNYEDARNVASCLMGSIVNSTDEELIRILKTDAFILAGIMTRKPFSFVCEGEHASCWHWDEISIDLTSAQPCIYQCMKYGLKVEVEFYSQDGEFDLRNKRDCRMVLRCLEDDDIKSIKLLNLDQMDGCEVVG